MPKKSASSPVLVQRKSRSGSNRTAAQRRASGRAQYNLSLSDATVAILDALADIHVGPGGRSGAVTAMAKYFRWRLDRGQNPMDELSIENRQDDCR